MDLLEYLKIDLGILNDSKDDMLNRLIAKAKADVIAFTHQSEDYIISNLSETVLDIATVRYNQRNAEGLTSQSYSGSSENYVNDIPANIRRVLVTHRKVGWKK